MKRVSFCEETQVYYPIMQGEVHWIQNQPLASEEAVSKRRSRFQTLRREMKSTLRLSQTLSQATYSDTKKQERKERLQNANDAWQDKDTDTEFVVVKYLLFNFLTKIKNFTYKILSSSFLLDLQFHHSVICLHGVPLQFFQSSPFLQFSYNFPIIINNVLPLVPRMHFGELVCQVLVQPLKLFQTNRP